MDWRYILMYKSIKSFLFMDRRVILMYESIKRALFMDKVDIKPIRRVRGGPLRGAVCLKYRDNSSQL